MSLATLKKKTATKYNNMSVSGPFSKNGFSLYGTRRNQGYIGQDTLGRSLPKTIMKGNVQHGHGGCCGTYDVHPIVQSAVTSTNDPLVVKNAVLSTRGLLAKRKCNDCPVVKPDNNLNNNTQGDRVKFLKEETLLNADSDSCGTASELCCNKVVCKNVIKQDPIYDLSNWDACDIICKNIKKFNIIQSKSGCEITKDIHMNKGLSYDVYLSKLTKKCYDKDLVNYKFVKTTLGTSTLC